MAWWETITDGATDFLPGGDLIDAGIGFVSDLFGGGGHVDEQAVDTPLSNIRRWLSRLDLNTRAAINREYQAAGFWAANSREDNNHAHQRSFPFDSPFLIRRDILSHFVDNNAAKKAFATKLAQGIQAAQSAPASTEPVIQPPITTDPVVTDTGIGLPQQPSGTAGATAGAGMSTQTLVLLAVGAIVFFWLLQETMG